MSWNISEITDQWSFPWYDFDSAVYTAGSWYSYLQLFEPGCRVGNGWNCTAACLDTNIGPTLVWNSTSWTNSTYTLQNCIVYPVIASLLASNQLNARSVEIAKKYNIQPHANLWRNATAGWPGTRPIPRGSLRAHEALPEPLLPTVTMSRMEPKTWKFCESNEQLAPGCKNTNAAADVQSFVFTPSEGYAFNQSNGFYPINITTVIDTGLCNNLNAVINPDIGGIGMFVSYLMQMFIVLSAWLLFHLYQTWAGMCGAPNCCPQPTALPKLYGSEHVPRTSHHSAALVSALVEFQKAQVFFMLAVQCAALIAIHNPAYVQSTSWQQLLNNLGILYDLAFGGCLPVLFALFIMRLAGKRSVYTLAFTCCCVALSATTWFLTFYIQLDSDADIINPGRTLPACGGGNVTPIKYCYSADWFYRNADATTKAIPALAFCFVVQICLILDQLLVFKVPTPEEPGRKGNCFDWLRHQILRWRMWESYERSAKKYPRWTAAFRLDTGNHLLGLMQGTVLLGTECAFVALNIILILDYAHILLPNSFQTLDLKAWTLGQVISVTIWIPVLLEYVWFAMVGPEEGFEHRLPENYQLVRKPTDQYDDVELKGKDDTPSSAVDLAQMPPITRPRYERINSDMQWQGPTH
ncbi:hypothetical protein BAUCODRAFT_146537 [Baudoinia panamericana UAMH 10762]|uniref:Uncharacterized protein n=1 Tax=Baudoinia panamericana (strain UAMH 10762) TaxID=717646 RepID=M2MML6_BAUPA|nr:uncharacterized protein BAUCODRAFT_146537 [Baudoinia panamericana UAMH 10762]EMC97936.1 hypothetical protein BAUCODRAFT_146537 [Baudoinia panamericana UAMH 10762]